MIKISQNPTYNFPINAVLPGGEEVSFTAIFRRLTQPQIIDLNKRIAKQADDPAKLEARLTDETTVAELLAGVSADTFGGSDRPMSFTAAELAKLIVDINKGIVKSHTEQVAAQGGITDDEVIKEVLAGWGDDVKGEDDLPLPFTPENVSKLTHIYPIRPALVHGYFASVDGAKAKNS